MNNKRGSQLVTLFVFIFILSLFIISAQPAFQQDTNPSVNKPDNTILDDSAKIDIAQKVSEINNYTKSILAKERLYGIDAILSAIIGLIIGIGFQSSKIREKKKLNILSVIIALVIGYIYGIFAENTLGLISILIGAIICYVLFEILKLILFSIKDSSNIIKDISESFIFKVNGNKFIAIYTLILGSIFLLLNIPIISLFKPLFQPLFIDFSSNLFLPTLTLFDKIRIGLGTYILRGIAFGLMTFLLLLMLIILFKAYRIIEDTIIYYQKEKSKIKTEIGTNEAIEGIHLARMIAKAGKDKIK